MRSGKLPYVKSVTAKGRRYEYFDTGAVNARGRPILKRLPAREDVSFGSVYASLLAGRTRRANVAAELTLPRLIALYDASPEFRKLARSTQENYGTYLQLLGDQLSAAPVRELARQDVMLLRDTMAARPGAANAMVRTLGALFKWARAREYVDHDPCKGIEMFVSRDYKPWPEQLLKAGLAAPDPAISLPIALLYYTAQRIGDVCALRWSDVREGYVHLRQQKTGKEMEIKIHRDLSEILMATKPRGLTILADSRGRAALPDTLRLRIQKFAADEGHPVVPHGLRKNAVNAFLEAGCSVAETAAVTGQSLGMVEHYAKLRSGRRLSTAAILKMEGGKA
ncbi:MAG: tyrosine-type recombinase/integrase [Sphingomonas sp.]